MSLRSRLRDDFPPGWWRCPGWWGSGLKDLGLWLVAVLATVLLVRWAWRAVTDRNAPVRLARIDGEKSAAALLVNLAGSAGFGAGLLAQEFPIEVEGLVTVWWLLCTANAAVALVVVAVLVASRLRSRVEWSMLDYVDDHRVPDHRPPETTEEYRATRLREALADGHD